MGSYTPTLSELLSVVSASDTKSSTEINLDNQMQLATQVSMAKMAQNEREMVRHREDVKSAYASVDPSKLDGTLDSDREVLMGKVGSVMDALQKNPEALSNPNSEGYANFQKSYLDASQSIYKSKMRKMKVDGDKALMDKNPDFNTPENRTAIDWFQKNYDANPDEVKLTPKLISPLPFFEAINESTKRETASIVDNGQGFQDEMTKETHDLYNEKLDDLYENGRWTDGQPFGAVFERDVYNNNKALKEKYSDPKEAFMALGAEYRAPDRITKVNREASQSIKTLADKQAIEAKAHIKEAQGKSNIDVNEYERKKKIDQKYTSSTGGGSKVQPEILKSIYEAESKAINESDLLPDEKLNRLRKAQDRIYGPLITAFAAVENGGKTTPDVHKPTGTAFGAFGWIKDNGHLKEAYNKGVVGGKYKSYSDFWSELHKGGDAYTDALKQYSDFLAVDVKEKTGVKEVSLADMLAYNLYGKAGVDAYRSGNFDYATNGNTPVGQYVKNGLRAARYAEGPEKVDSGYGKRNDGTEKGNGFFGPLQMKDGSGKTATELSIGIEIDGKETEIPTLVPTLTASEKDWLLKGGNIAKDNSDIAKNIRSKAIANAKSRIEKGESPFATTITNKWDKYKRNK